MPLMTDVKEYVPQEIIVPPKKPSLLSSIKNVLMQKVPQALNLQYKPEQQDARFAIAGSMADEEISTRLQDPVVRTSFADAEAKRMIAAKQANTMMGVSAEEFDQTRKDIYDNLDNYLEQKHGILTPAKQRERLVSTLVTMGVAAAPNPLRMASEVAGFTGINEGLRRTLFPAVKRMVEGKDLGLAAAGPVASRISNEPVDLKQAIHGEGQLTGALADIAQLALGAGATGGLSKGLDNPAVKAAVDAAKVRIGKVMGKMQEGFNATFHVPTDYAKAVNEGRMSLGEAARKSKKFFEAELAKRIKGEVPLEVSRQPMAGGMMHEAPKYVKDKLEQGVTITDVNVASFRIVEPVKIKDVHGNQVDLPKGHEFTEVHLSNGKIWLHDGKNLVVSKDALSQLPKRSYIQLGESKFMTPEEKDVDVVRKGEKIGYNPQNIEMLKRNGEEVQRRIDAIIEKYPVINERPKELNDEVNQLRQSSLDINNEIRQQERQKSDTKFSQYTLPGGENYREVLIRGNKNETKELPEGYDVVHDPLIKEGDKDKYWVIPPGQIHARPFEGKHRTKEEAIKSALNRVNSENTSNYTSSHWEEPNVIAHYRANDRITPDGKKVMFLEEIQSDWAKELRVKGVSGDFEKAQKEAQDYLQSLYKKYNSNNQMARTLDGLATKTEREEYYRLRDIANNAGQGVPNHPLLKNWQELALKNALKDAVESGADYLSWVTGEQTAARYDLSKQIDSVTIAKTPDNFTKGKLRVTAYKNGNVEIEKFVNDYKEVSDLVGKDLSAKSEKEISAGKDTVMYEGQDLKVGGEWAKNLYDKQIPSILKKLTGQDVEVIEVPTNEIFTKKKLPSTEYEVFDSKGISRGVFYSAKEANSFITKMSEGKINVSVSEQHAIRITPKVKALVLGEQPMAGGLPVNPEKYSNVTLDDFLYGAKDIEEDFDALDIDHQRDIAFEAQQKIDLAEMVDAPEANLGRAVRELGGITIKGRGEEWSWVPVWMRGSRTAPDEMVEQLKDYGFHFEYEEDFRKALKAYVERPSDEYHIPTLNRFIKRYARNEAANKAMNAAIERAKPSSEPGFYEEPVTFKTKQQVPMEGIPEKQVMSKEGEAVKAGAGRRPVQIDLSGLPEPDVDINKGRNVPEDIKSVLIGKTPEMFTDLSKWEGMKGGVTTLAPLRAMEKMDGKQYGIMKDRFLKPIQQADFNFQVELKAKKAEIEDLFKDMPIEQRQAVFGVAEKDMTATDEKLAKQFPRIEAVAKRLRDLYDELFDRINKEREYVGKDPIQKRRDYITHYVEMGAWADIVRTFGGEWTDVPKSMEAISMNTKPGTPYFKYAKRRETDITMRDSKDAVLNYLEPAMRFIHFAKATKGARDILEFKIKMPSEYEGNKEEKVSAFAMKYPNAYDYLTQYVNRLTGKRDLLDKILPIPAQTFGAFQKLFGAGSIGGNLASAFVQLTSFRNAIAETGVFAIKGYAKLFDENMRGLASAKSRILKGREYEPAAVQQRFFGSKKLAKGFDKTSKALNFLVGTMDRVMASGAWLSAYYKGKHNGLKGEELFRYCDDVVERTQASANVVDRPPINYGKIKTMAGQFQTFVYNEFSQLKEDIVKPAIFGENSKQGYGEGLSGMRRSRIDSVNKLAYFLLATAAIAAVYETLGLPNPMRNEDAEPPFIKAKSRIAKLVYGYLINEIPFLSTVRFGGSPFTQGALKGIVLLSGGPREKAEAAKKLQSIGARLVPGGGQMYKTFGAIKVLAQGGKDKDKRGRIKFQIDTDNIYEVAKALIWGKWQSKAGQEYLDKLNGRKPKKKQTAAKKTTGRSNPLLKPKSDNPLLAKS